MSEAPCGKASYCGRPAGHNGPCGGIAEYMSAARRYAARWKALARRNRAFAAYCQREAAIAMARLDEALAVLREVEWQHKDAEGACDWCPYCGIGKQYGHAPACRLAKVIGENE